MKKLTKQQRIENNIAADKEIIKRINNSSFTSVESFISNAKRYINAIKDGRMLCIVTHVSQSGMSRRFKYLECNGKNGNCSYLNFYTFHKVLGYNHGNDDAIKVSGCGMNMNFHTNYSIIHRLGRLGFLNKSQVNELSQKTPTCV